MSDIERELEMELHRVLDRVASMPIPPRRASVRARGVGGRLLGSAGAAVTFKILTGVAVAAAAVTVAGAATTGSLDPAVWGQQVSQEVQTCKNDLGQGHGIGDCVSAFASQHGQAVASAARQHGNANGHSNNGNNGNNGNGNNGNNAGGNGNGNGHKTTPNPNEPKDPSSHAAPKVSPGP